MDLSSLKPSIKSSLPKDPLINLWDFLYKMSTRSVVSELSPSEELKLVFLNPTCLLHSPQWTLPLMLNLLKCITNLWIRPFQATTLDSTLKTYLLRISEEEMYALMLKMIQHLKFPISQHKSLSSITLVKSKVVIALSWTATLATLPSNSKKSFLPLTEELVKLLKNSQNSSRLVKPVWLIWFPLNPCALKFSLNILPSEDLPSETWNKQLPSVLLRKSPKLPLKGPPRRNDPCDFLY